MVVGKELLSSICWITTRPGEFWATASMIWVAVPRLAAQLNQPEKRCCTNLNNNNYNHNNNPQKNSSTNNGNYCDH